MEPLESETKHFYFQLANRGTYPIGFKDVSEKDSLKKLSFLLFTMESISLRTSHELLNTQRMALGLQPVTRIMHFSFPIHDLERKFFVDLGPPTISMMGFLNFTPKDSRVSDMDFCIELEAFPSINIASLCLPQEGHHPAKNPHIIGSGIGDFIKIDIKMLDLLSKFRKLHDETIICQSFYPVLVLDGPHDSAVQIRNDYDLDSIREFICEDCKKGNHKSMESVYSCPFILAQYREIKSQCAARNIRIIGKCPIFQRIIFRSGYFYLEKGINGYSIIELGKIALSKCLIG